MKTSCPHAENFDETAAFHVVSSVSLSKSEMKMIETSTMKLDIVNMGINTSGEGGGA